MSRHILKYAVNLCAWLTWLPSTAQDGTFDPTFNPGDAGMARLDGLHYAAIPAAYPGEGVRVMAVQPDGKLLVGGWFSGGLLERFDPVMHPGIARLNTDGTPDVTFNAGSGFDGPVEAIAVQGDGKILVGGAFLTCQGASRKGIARLHSDGSLDGSFTVGTGAGGTVTEILVQANTLIVLGGNFTLFNGAVANRIVRLLPDGSVDPSFTTGSGFNAPVKALAQQVDGRLLVGGEFTDYDGATRSYLVRLLPNGLLDATYLDPLVYSGPNATVNDIAVGSGGTSYVTGDFTTFNGVSRTGVKLDWFGAIDPAFVVNFHGTGLHYHVPTNALWSWDDIGILKQNGTTGATLASQLTHLANGGRLSQCASNIMDWSCSAVGPSQEVYRVEPIHTGIMRVDGTLLAIDEEFRPGTGLGWINQSFDMTMDEFGRVLLAGRQDELTRTMPAYNGRYRPNLIRLTTEGEIDETFTFPYNFEGTINRVRSIGNGRTVLAGQFNFSCTATTSPSQLLFSTLVIYDENDQSLTPLQVPGCAASPYGPAVMDVLPLASGKILYIGEDECSGTQRDIGRFNTDGSWDGTYTTTSLEWVLYKPERAAEAPDGKVYVVGNFIQANGISRNKIVRLLPNGGVDPTFDPLGGFNGRVADVIVNPDGTVVCVGDFTTYRGQPAPRIAKLLPDASPDPSFNPGTGFGGGIGIGPRRLLRAPDGRLLVSGNLANYNSVPRHGLIRLHADGTFDDSFDTGTGFRIVYNYTGAAEFYPGYVNDIEMQPNGQLVCLGEFHMYDGNGRNRLARIGSGVRSRLMLRVLLEGPAQDGGNGPDEMFPLLANYWMNCTPCMAGIVPTPAPPFNGNERAPAAALLQQGPGAIVDWIRVELRDAIDPTAVVAVRHGLLRADGWIVDTDGQSLLEFPGVFMGAYHILIRHRNHLGVMTAFPVFIGSQPIPINLTNATYELYGTDAAKQVGDLRMLWAGDVNGDGVIKYVGQGNDRDPILVAIGGNVPTNTVTGRIEEDVNLDGAVKYVGDGNDRDPILVNIGGNVPTNTRQAQLP